MLEPSTDFFKKDCDPTKEHCFHDVAEFDVSNNDEFRIQNEEFALTTRDCVSKMLDFAEHDG